MAARFIRIAIKDRLQVNALQSTEQQRDDGDRLDHTKPHSGLIPHVSLPDREKVCIAATSSVKFFNKLYLYQCPTYGTGLTRRIVGLSVLTTHYAVLVVQALWNALFHNPPPLIFHSDNGTEYDAAVTRRILVDFRIAISR